MTLTKPARRGPATTRSLIKSLIETPNLERTIQALAPQTFAALIRKVGVEDAGELVALATTQQLVQAFDEDLFVSAHAGERETLDAGRFVAWLEVLLEAGDEVAANRIAELDEDFVAHALANILLVLDEEALRQRLDEAEHDESRKVDKALESALAEEIDGYLLIAKQHDGWDAALALILALDRNHRSLLVRLLDRLAAVASSYLDDLDELSTLLTEAESLAEDVEAAREERRARQGYIEPRAARSFLALARKPSSAGDSAAPRRDPVTRAYFRLLERQQHRSSSPSPARAALAALPTNVQRELDAELETADQIATATSAPANTLGTFRGALQELKETVPDLFGERIEELAYLANVLLAGHERDGLRMTPKAAGDAVIATVCFGAILELRARPPSTKHAASTKRRAPTREELYQILRERSADFLFRVSSSAMASGVALKPPTAQESALLYSAEELEEATTA